MFVSMQARITRVSKTNETISNAHRGFISYLLIIAIGVVMTKRRCFGVLGWVHEHCNGAN